MDDTVWAFLMLMLGVAGIICIIGWVLSGIAHMKMLRLVGYAYPWMAWIPFLKYYAMADAIPGDEVRLFGTSMSKRLFSFWWALTFIVPLIPAVGTILNVVLTVICLGQCYTVLFAVTDRRDISETTVIGHISAAFPIVAVFKYLFRRD